MSRFKAVKAAADDPLVVQQHFLRTFHRLHIANAHVQQFGTRVAAHPAVRIVNVEHFPTGIAKQVAIGGRRDQGGILVGQPSLRLFRLLTRRQVGSHQAGFGRLLPWNRLQRHLHRHQAPILALELYFSPSLTF